MSPETFTIGQLCAEFDVTPRTLCFYEYKELLSPIRDGQRRIFTCRDRARLKLILRGRRFGFRTSATKSPGTCTMTLGPRSTVSPCIAKWLAEKTNNRTKHWK